MSPGFDSTELDLAGYTESNPSFPGLASLPVESPFMYPRPTDDQVLDGSIVIVEDDPSIASLLQHHLRRVGFRKFRIISDSSTAFAEISEVLPDIVLLDLHMPPVSGWEVLDHLRRDDKTQHIPVLIQTSATDEQTRIQAFNRGAHDFLTKPILASELVARVRNTLAAKIYRDRMTQYSLQLEFDVLTDCLTGIANRRAFDYELRRRLVDWNRQRNPLCLLMMDVDHFKLTNDRYGHQAGDAALIEIANILKQSVRELDLVARIGGEEFAVILPYSTTKDCLVVAERAREAISKRIIEFRPHEFRISASAGVAEVADGDDAELLIRRADAALYRAKQGGRNRTYYHTGFECQCVTIEQSGAVQSSEDKSPKPKPKSVGTIDQSKIAIIDDEPHIIALVRKYLRDAGYQNFVTIADAVQALPTLRAENPDLVLLDIRMPKVNGLDILQQIREDRLLKSIPVLIFTSATDMETKVRSLELGANDYCEKPLHVGELTIRVRNNLLAKAHVDSLNDHSNQLESEVAQRTAEVEESRQEAIQCLARAAEMRDDNTGKHTLRVGKYAAIIARELGLGSDRVVWLECAAQLHDVGKIGVPDSILLKPGALTKDEFAIMQRHCDLGSRIIRNDAHPAGSARQEPGHRPFQSPLMQMAALIAESHHERWDGTGYPKGLKGEKIPLEGRITAVADVFDALSTARPYKKAMPLEQCFTILSENRGSHFDPLVLDAFFRCKSEIVRTYQEYSDQQQT
jgi:putative two-component system response regulator